jgi:hypothetical protein
MKGGRGLTSATGYVVGSILPPPVALFRLFRGTRARLSAAVPRLLRDSYPRLWVVSLGGGSRADVGHGDVGSAADEHGHQRGPGTDRHRPSPRSSRRTGRTSPPSTCDSPGRRHCCQRKTAATCSAPSTRQLTRPASTPTGWRRSDATTNLTPARGFSSLPGCPPRPSPPGNVTPTHG